ncbi:MAG: hypothetical protein JW384_01332 [Nitrosomonadaceae bacterium]|nr:hypothetical protein [Nitrosomonadaceae bacterium]
MAEGISRDLFLRQRIRTRSLPVVMENTTIKLVRTGPQVCQLAWGRRLVVVFPILTQEAHLLRKLPSSSPPTVVQESPILMPLVPSPDKPPILCQRMAVTPTILSAAR